MKQIEKQERGNIMKKKETAQEDFRPGKRLLPKVLLSVLILLLVGTSGLLGFAAFKQNALLKEKDKKLAEVKSSLDAASDDTASLKEEILNLKSTLADCSSYLSEEDLDSENNLPDSSNSTAENDSSNETDQTDDEEDSDSADESDKEKDSLAYQKKYKNLYVSDKDASSGKVVHLTFDDGPSQNTPKVLDILDKYDVKATFFVVYNDEEPYCNYYKEIVERGHTLAIHTASHNYKKIYASVDAYLEDFNQIYSYVYEKTGVRPTLFRYPGGSTNCLSYNAGPAIMEEMERRGFTYYDWNVSSGDGGNQATRSTIYDWVTSKAVKLNESVVLMHDSGGKGETVSALPSIIETLQDAGCVFEPLSSSTEPVQFQSSKKKSN